MYFKVTTFLIVLGISNSSDAFFFGLFKSRPTTKPDVIVRKPGAPETDRIAYENYLSSLARTYSPYPYSSTYYMPVFSNYAEPQHTMPRFEYVYPINAYQSGDLNRLSVPYDQQTIAQSSRLYAPINVLPSVTYDETLLSIPEVVRVPKKPEQVNHKEDVLEYKIPESQMSTSLYELPIPGIAPNFRMGAYLTRPSIATASHNEKHTGRKFSHAYNSGDGTKVSEEGEVVHLKNGEETVVKRGQYEYIDAEGKPVLVKWIADDDGFKLVN